jgi:TPR repeat protein
MAKSSDWLERWQEVADSGDPDALIIVAWEYVKGEMVEKDVDRAFALFRAAEKLKPALA